MKKKILIMQPDFCVGGVEKVLLTTLRFYNRDKFDVSLLLRNPNLWDSKIPSDVNVKYLFKSNPRLENPLISRLFKYCPMFLPQNIIRRLMSVDGFDVYIAFHEPMIYLLRGAKGKKIAWIHADYGTVETLPEIKQLKNPNGFLANLIYKRRIKVYDLCDNIVCVAKSVKEGFITKFKYVHSKVIHKYNVLDIESIVEQSKAKIKVKLPANITFCTVGRFSTEKAYYRVVTAAEQLDKLGYKFNIIMVGNGPLFKQIQSLINSKNLENRFFLVGYDVNPYKYMAKSHCLLSSSYYEAFSTVVCESMVLNLPVITTNCSGMREIFGDSKAGVIVENNDTSLFYAMKNILDDTNELDCMKKATYSRQEFLNPKNTITQIENLLEDL